VLPHSLRFMSAQRRHVLGRGGAVTERRGCRPAVHLAEVVGEVAQAPIAARGHRETGVCPVEDASKGRSLAAQCVEVIHGLDPGTEV